MATIAIFLATMTHKPARRRILTPEVRLAKERRLNELEEQAAILGTVNTPPHITTEIEDLQAELELVDIIQRQVDPNVTAIVKSTDYGELLSKFIGDHARRLTSIELWQSNRDDKIEADDEKREERQTYLDNRLSKIDVNIRTVTVICGFNALLIVIFLIILLVK